MTKQQELLRQLEEANLNYFDLKDIGTRPAVVNVTLDRLEDDDPDTSYLEQDGFEDRLAAYRNGDYYYIGIQATAQVAIPNANGKSVTLQTITSGGSWGIESDSDSEYIEEVENDELGDLVNQLNALNIVIPTR